MAITPQQADTLREKESIEVVTHERYIDESLKEHFIPGIPVAVTISTVKDRVCKELIRRYEKAGWTVTCKYQYDQRDGDYTRFTFSSNKGKTNSLEKDLRYTQYDIPSQQWDR